MAATSIGSKDQIILTVIVLGLITWFAVSMTVRIVYGDKVLSK